jgi:NAD(P)-dependent dehydrogenase (short-subunit alcohol dehydrogenase family)
MVEPAMLVTGAFGALGQVTVKAALRGGWRVAGADIAATPPPALGAGDRLALLPGLDLTQAVDADRAVQGAVEQFGRLDALLNIAGGFSWNTLADSTPELWERLFRLNVQTAANVSRAAAERLKASGRGRIVNVGAAAAERAAAGMGAYAAAKAGVHRLTESLAEELRSSGITVNAVLPTIIDTPQNRRDMPEADTSGWIPPERLAELMLFLAAQPAADLTGHLLRVSAP